jgi:endonuclease YncB( thermonuclease family)
MTTKKKQYFDTFRRDIREVIDIHDGDTLTALVDTGYDGFRKIVFRLEGINTAELSSDTEIRKTFANNAKDYVVSKLEDKQVAVESIRFKDGSFSRYLGVIYYLDDGVWQNLNEELKEIGLAQVYYKGASKDEGEFK